MLIGIESCINKRIMGAGIRLAGQNKQKAYIISSEPTKRVAQQGAYSIYWIANKSCITFLALCPLSSFPINKNVVFRKITKIRRQ